MSRFAMPARLATCALLAAGVLALTTPAQATPAVPSPTLTFSDPAVVSPADDTIMDTRVIAAGDGSVTVFWTRSGGWSDSDGWTRPLMASTRLAGEMSWSTHELSELIYTRLPELAGGSAADGTVTVTWEQGLSGPSEIYSATRAAGTTSWSAPLRISTDETRGTSPAALVRADGSAVVAWTTYTPGKSVRYATRGAGTDAPWSAPKQLEVGADDDYFNPPVLTEDGSGNIALLYVRDDGTTGTHILRSATLAPGSTTFSSPEDAATESANRVEYLTATALPGGDLVAAWLRPGSRHMGPATMMAVRRTGGVWQPPSQVSADAAPERPLHLAADRLGNVIVLWTAADDPEEYSHYRVSAAVSSSGGTWSAPFYPAGTGQASKDGRVLNARGWVVGLWPVATTYADATPQYALASNLGAGFGASTPFGSAISPNVGVPPTFAAGLDGTVVAVWQGPDFAIRVSIAAAGQLPDLDPKPPVTEPTPPADVPEERVTPPVIVDPPAPRLPQLLIQGRRVVVNVRVTLRRGGRCAGTVSAASWIGATGTRTTHGKGLRLKAANRDGRRICVISGSLTLRRAPAAGQPLRVAFRNPNLRLRARIATHGG